ncbi:MAG: aminoglycoside phosphotransferase family protein [Lachnospiraceae bacterium]|nr:aminoglycoside phosphotransferase family protein [Lachnospiraceae bacterium]
MTDLHRIAEAYGLQTEFVLHGHGNIHDTYRSADSRYLLQRINTHVFTRPREVMENIVGVTEHLRRKVREEGGDPGREVLTIVRTRDGQSYYQNEDGYFRVYLFIEHSQTVEPEEAGYDNLYQAAVGFGRFQKQLADYDAASLHETIPDFHNTVCRLSRLKEAMAKDPLGRLAAVQSEIDFIMERSAMAETVLKGLESGDIPLCVTHNDTKVNNVLFDKESGKALCVIDLDTIMPGSRLYDFGDALRSAGVNTPEDEPDLSKVCFDARAYEAFLRGYLSEMKDTLTPREKELLPFSVRLLAYELGIRFLTDYLNGDVYFKTSRPGQNLDRTRTQLRLVEILESMDGELRGITEEALAGA